MRHERRVRGWSQHDLARRARVTQQQLSRLENGGTGTSRRVLQNIAGAFALPTASIFPYDDALPDIANAS